MKTLYFECFSGISGDMTIAALLDIGASKEKLMQAIESLSLDGYSIQIHTVQKCGITATKFDVTLLDQHEHSHSHGEHEHEHSHEEHEHSHGEHRGLKEIQDIITDASMTKNAKALALHIFDVLAQAEGKVHGVSKNEVHFHEVGAVDSIIDIIGIAVCIDDLGISSFACSPLYEGGGHIWCQHGKMPVPVPATLELCTTHQIPLIITEVQGEMITPTGAAFIAAIQPQFGTVPAGKIHKVGLGAGTKDFPHANILRVYLIDEANTENNAHTDEVILLETNIDDSTGEELGFAMEKLLTAGALDAYYTSIFMKKNRPAYMLSVLCEQKIEQDLIKLIFKHTSAIGLRKQKISRVKMSRNFEKQQTDYGEITIKRCTYADIEKSFFEYEDLKTCAEKHGVDLQTIKNSMYKKTVDNLK